MSKERILDDITRKSGMLSTKTVYFGDVYTEKLNGVPISTMKKEGSDELAPISYDELYNEAARSRNIEYEENKIEHDYEYSNRAMMRE